MAPASAASSQCAPARPWSASKQRTARTAAQLAATSSRVLRAPVCRLNAAWPGPNTSGCRWRVTANETKSRPKVSSSASTSNQTTPSPARRGS